MSWVPSSWLNGNKNLEGLVTMQAPFRGSKAELFDGKRIGETESIDATTIMKDEVERQVEQIQHLLKVTEAQKMSLKPNFVDFGAINQLIYPPMDIEVIKFPLKYKRFMHHRKKRIQKKWAKRYGRRVLYKDCRITNVKTGEMTVEFKPEQPMEHIILSSELKL